MTIWGREIWGRDSRGALRAAGTAAGGALLLILGVLACGPCGAEDPQPGTCTCPDGTALEKSECDICDGIDSVDLGALLATQELAGTVRAACGSTEINFFVHENA